jgi:hypothetical protein
MNRIIFYLRMSFVVFLLLIFTTKFLNGQTTKKVSTKYMRPSVLNLFLAPSDSKEGVIISSFKNLPMVKKFDDHSINYPDLTYSLPSSPRVPAADADVSAKKEYNKKIHDIDSIRQLQFNDYFAKASNLILSKWWNRDANGNFNVSLVSERGSYTATDADVLADKAAAASRLQDLGEQLINKTFVVFYDINEVKTMNEVYNEQDAAGAKIKGYQPVKRTLEGYETNYTAYLYKLDFNDSVAAIFYNNYWSSSDNHDQKKVDAWGSATFPLVLVTQISGSASSTQSNDPNNYKFKRRKTMDELLQAFPSNIQSEAISKMTKKVPDFQIKVTVAGEKPLTAKLGTKEGLSLDQRYFIYEIQLDEATNQQFKKRKGVARATSDISKNDNVASGETKPSVFRQQGGKKIYQGMFMEEHNDFGVAISAGYRSNPSDLALSGICFGLDYDISKALYKMIPAKGVPAGLYLGASLSFNSMKDVKPGYIKVEDTDDYATDATNWSGNTLAFEFALSKEMYFTGKGNIYLLPSIAYGATSINFTKYGDQSLTEDLNLDEDAMKQYQWSATTMQFGMGLGMNFGPAISILIKPMYVIKSAYTDGNDKSMVQDSDVSELDSKWKDTFINIGKSKSTLPINASLKIRL